MNDFWTPLRRHTPARIGMVRRGEAVSTHAALELAAAHAEARDAVHRTLDIESVTRTLEALGLATPIAVQSAAPDRAAYLTRPDLGRRPAVPLNPTSENADVLVVVADGLSPLAIERHAAGLLALLLPLLPADTTYAQPVIATQARVAIGDHLGAACGARLVLTLIGERPGLSAADSLGAYMTWAPRVGMPDSARNCVSNIRPPHGLSYAEAAATVAFLMTRARELKMTGVNLKDGRESSVNPRPTGQVC